MPTHVLSNKDTNSLSCAICQLAWDWRGRIFTVGTQGDYCFGVFDDCVGVLVDCTFILVSTGTAHMWL